MQVNPLIVFRKEFDHSGLLFNPDNGEACGLNPTSAFIWECLARSMEKPEIVSALSEAAAGIPATVGDDIDEFIAALQEKGFLSL